MTSPKFVAVAKIGAPKGLKGCLKIHLLSDSSLDSFKDLYLFLQENFNIDKSKYLVIDKSSIIKDNPKDKSSKAKFLLKISGVNSPEDARKYVNNLVCVKRDSLPRLNPGEYYWADLEGMSVFNLQDIYLGKVDYLLETGSNDVMFVVNKEDNKTRCLPFLSPYLIEVDLESKKILVDWDPDF